MTKLKLSLIQEAGEILTPKELKKIIGGTHYGSGTCGVYIPEIDNSGGIPFPPLGSLPTGSSAGAGAGGTILRGISKDTALALIQGIPGAKWCCDSCNEASWY